MNLSTVGTIVFASSTALFGATACSSATPTDPGTTPTGNVTPEPAKPTTPTPGGEINPYGVAYPTVGFGKTARKGSTPGGVFANLKFTGYPDADKTKGLQPVSMADFYDPEMRNFKIIIVAGTGNWCGYCKKEVQEVTSTIDQFKEAKVGFVNAVLESSSHAPATQTDLDSWVTTYKISFPTFLDPGGEQLNEYGQSFPVNFILDARSMEILATVLGSPSEGTLKRSATYTKWVDSHPATTYE